MICVLELFYLCLDEPHCFLFDQQVSVVKAFDDERFHARVFRCLLVNM